MFFFFAKLLPFNISRKLLILNQFINKLKLNMMLSHKYFH